MAPWVDECASTNDLVRRAAEEGAPHGHWVAARRQTAGRGRQGREWQSLEGNLLFSWLARPRAQTPLTWVPLAAAVGVAEELRERLALPVRIKWPNDLWVGDAKLGGILCEAAQGFVVVGVGLNCAQSPRGLEPPATSLSAAIGREIYANEALPWALDGLEHAFRQLESLGPAALAEKFERWALFQRGRRVQWANGAHRGRVEGLGPLGELIVRNAQGATERLYAEEVQGLRAR